MHGRALIAFDRIEGRDRLADLYQRAPLRVLFPDPPDGEPLLAALVTTSGGLAGGDRLELDITVGAGARAVVVASAAEKIYRSTGADVTVEVELTAETGGWLEFLPQETILFEGSRLRRRTCLEVAAGAQILAGEMLVFGRTARGESLTTGLARDVWEVRKAGRLAWMDALHLDGQLDEILAAPSGFDGANACATLVLVADDAGAQLDAIRAGLESYGGRAGATLVNGVLVARWLDKDAARLRHSFGAVWMKIRNAAGGLPTKMPRIWEI